MRESRMLHVLTAEALLREPMNWIWILDLSQIVLRLRRESPR
jgi:hypothetical protein